MWRPLASELGVPWRAAEGMHWQLGEIEMARRAGVVPFSMAPAVSSLGQPPTAMPTAGAGGLPYLSEDPRSGPGYLPSAPSSSSQSPAAMLPAGAGGTPYLSEDSRGGPGYFAEDVPGRSSFDTGENVGRIGRTRGTVSPGGTGGGGGRGTGSNFPHGAILPSMEELDKGMTAFDNDMLPGSSARHGVPARRGRVDAEQRRRGKP